MLVWSQQCSILHANHGNRLGYCLKLQEGKAVKTTNIKHTLAKHILCTFGSNKCKRFWNRTHNIWWHLELPCCHDFGEKEKGNFWGVPELFVRCIMCFNIFWQSNISNTVASSLPCDLDQTAPPVYPCCGAEFFSYLMFWYFCFAYHFFSVSYVFFGEVITWS